MALPVMRWHVVTEPQPPYCGARPGKYSSARCEMPLGHRYEDDRENFHAGRTRRGYWKLWPVEEDRSPPHG